MDDVRAYLGLPDVGGPTGAGVRVAVLDTGIDDAHPDFSGAVDYSASRDVSEGDHGLRDTHFHGTHIAGIIAGRGTLSDGQYRGVAPDAMLIAIKISDDAEWEEVNLQRALDHALEAKADIINFSGERAPDPDQLTPPWVFGPAGITDRLFGRVARHGVLCVVAAGNRGPEDGTIGWPAGLDRVLAVGGIASTHGGVSELSSRGPFRWSRGLATSACLPLGTLSTAGRARLRQRAKPDLAAPAEDVYAPLSSTISLVAQQQARRQPGSYGGRYFPMSGTSQGAAVMSGLAACLLGYLRDAGISAGADTGLLLKTLLSLAAHREGRYAAEEVGAGVVRWPALQTIADRYLTDRLFQMRIRARILAR